MLQDYKAFLFRGNLLDLAVAFILGVAFQAAVDAFTNGVVMQLVAAVVGEPNFDRIVVFLGDTPLLVGAFLTALVNFVLVATMLFFVVRAAAAADRPEPEDAPTPASDEVLLLQEIRDLLRANARE